MFDPLDISAIRSTAWRLGRCLYFWARRDVPSDPATNGEYWLLEKLISQSEDNATLLDIGANRGDWTQKACDLLERRGRNGQIHAFEPTRSTFTFLADRFQGKVCVCLHKTGLSDRNGVADFFVVGEFAGTNSLQRSEGVAIEQVQTQTLDEFVATVELEEVLFAKSDTEGHDMSVLRGAERSLREGRVAAWQFEYNHRWIANHSCLRDVFDFVEGKPYVVGKLYGGGIEIHESWHSELDRFFEANYVLIRKDIGLNGELTRVRFNSSNVAVVI